MPVVEFYGDGIVKVFYRISDIFRFSINRKASRISDIFYIITFFYSTVNLLALFL